MRYLVTGGAAAVIFAIPAFLAAVELPRTNERWTKTEFENFLIFYRPLKDGVAIERVFHAKQDYQRVLK